MTGTVYWTAKSVSQLAGFRGCFLRLGLDVFVGRPGLKTRLLFAPGVWPSGQYLRPVPERALSEGGEGVEHGPSQASDQEQS